jgi:hypothetical protein
MIEDKAYQVLLSNAQKLKILKLIQRPDVNYVVYKDGIYTGNAEYKGMEEQCLNLVLEEESDV